MKLLIALAAALVLLPGAARADNPVLVATVGANDSFSIALTDASGAKVTHLDPGTYTIQVHDLSEIHNFHLFGPGNVNVQTQVDTKEEVTWVVKLVDGTYLYDCDPHATVMKGSFTVGTVVTTPPPAKLAGSVGPGAKISLSPRTVTAGKVVLTVRDLTKKDNFRLRGRGVNVATGVGFRGTKRWALTLRAGTYTFRSDRTKKLRGTLSVS
jgi:hypothetical protein